MKHSGLLLGILLLTAAGTSCSMNGGSGGSTTDGPVAPDLYTGGYCKDSSGIMHAGYWKDRTWTELKNPYGSYDADSITQPLVSGDSIYSAGYCLDSSGTERAGYWRNGTWTELKNPYDTDTSSYGGIATSTVSDGSNLYMAAIYKNGPGVYSGYWKNGTWNEVENPYDTNETSYDRCVNSLFINGSDIYAAGYCIDGSDVWRAGYWKNGTWTELKGPSVTGSDNEECLMVVVSNGSVYACGDCVNNSRRENGYWKNGGWETLSGTSDSECTFITAYEGIIYICGYCVNNSNISTPGYWENGYWNALPVPYDVDTGVGAAGLSIVKTDSTVYTRGMYKSTNGVIKSGFWKDGDWYSLSNPYGSSYDAYADGRYGNHSESSSSDETPDKASSLSDRQSFISSLCTGRQ